MSTKREKQPTCADRVGANCESRMAELKAMYRPRDCPQHERATFFEDHGYNIGDEDAGLDLDEITDEIRSSYGLSFDYVEPDTFQDQPEGYWRYQISWGGPSEEVRFFACPDGRGGWSLHRAEFWFLDWFDGASRRLHGDQLETARAMFDDFAECGAVTLGDHE